MASEKLRRLGKVGAVLGFGWFVFVIVLYVSLPFDRFRDFLASRVSGMGYDMEAKHVGPSLGLGMTLKEVTLVSRSSDGSKPTRILVDKATLGVSLLSYLMGTKSYHVAADVFGGEVDVDVKLGKIDASARSRMTEIDLAEIPWVKKAINLPLSGKFGLVLDLDMPKQHLSEAKGTLTWTCTACALGDGKAKLVVASNPMLAEGLGLPKIRLGDFAGKIVFDKGVGRLQNIQFKSTDLEASVEGEIHLAQPIGSSHVDLYVRFKLGDSLLRSSENLRTIMDLTAQMGKRPDGFLGFRATGSFQNMGNVQWLKTSPFASSTAAPTKPGPPPRGPAPAPAPAPVAPAPVAPPPVAPPPVAPPPAAPPAPIPEPTPPPPPPPAPPPPPPPPEPPTPAPLPAPAAVPTSGPPTPAPMPTSVAPPSPSSPPPAPPGTGAGAHNPASESAPSTEPR